MVVGLIAKQSPASVKVCVLLDKKGRREVPFEADFVGFEIPDKFVVGYGLDFAERYRNLPCIGVLKPQLQNPPE
jgi:hypoxanthine phosphoribosyltransferase